MFVNLSSNIRGNKILTSSLNMLQYYHEQSTGRRFRSLVAIKRYISNKDTDMSTTPGTVSLEVCFSSDLTLSYDEHCF